MKFLKNRKLGWALVIVAAVCAVVIGQLRRPAELPKVSFQSATASGEWIADDAKLLDSASKSTVNEYNGRWNEAHRAIVAVATMKNIRGWTMKDAACQLGNNWGLGGKDMLLLMVPGEDYYVACGDDVLSAMTDTQQDQLKRAVEQKYYAGDYSAAAVAFFRQADVVIDQMFRYDQSTSYIDAYGDWESGRSGIRVGGIILLLLGFFLVWVLLDRIRYRRYQRRSTVVVGTPRVVHYYYPIFWGRTRAPSPPPAPRPVHPAPVQHSGGYTSRPSSPARPSAPRRPASSARPGGSGHNRPSGGSFGHGGFSGGKRGR